MRLFLATLVLSAPLLAQDCTYLVQPLTLTIPSGGAIGQISISTQTNCAWSAANPSLTWLHLDAMQGTGSGTVPFHADSNPTAVDRVGSITVAGATIAVTQSGAQCTYAINPKSATIGAAGGSGTFAVTSGCVWYVASNNGAFLAVPGGNTVRTGNGTANYTMAQNACVYGRTGSITVVTTSAPALSPVFALTQDGSNANMTFSPAAVSAAPEAADGRITVTTGVGCAWTATSSESWLQLTSRSGSGNGAITYHLLANNTAPRTGTITVGPLTITVTQDSVPAINTITNAANYRTDAVAPGEIVVLFGAKLGPAKLETLQVNGGFVTKMLAGTQVLFDGVAAPLVYVSDTQVSAVVPFGVAGKPATQVQVVNNGVGSNLKSMQVQVSHPGIFTLDSSGLGQGAILNQDYSVNGPGTPAARGSVVSIYATGGGGTLPAQADGEVTGSVLPYLTQNTTVTIGGIDAHVSYAGGAPGSLAGLIQINAEVPAGIAAGNAVPVLIRVGPYTSSQGVTLAVQ
jgi:uncharacterized protein (TIGR03437 family)